LSSQGAKDAALIMLAQGQEEVDTEENTGLTANSAKSKANVNSTYSTLSSAKQGSIGGGISFFLFLK